jgi:hypothetical protein
MCWNKDVSLNTFIFSSFVLMLIVYNNAFTKYKIHMMNNKWMILFFLSFIVIQLIEYFIWKNINNPVYNKFFSTLAQIVLLLQPIASLMLITNDKVRIPLIMTYLILSIPYSAYKFATSNIHSTVNKNGNLVWHFFNDSPMNDSPLIWMVWLFFFLISFVYQKNWTAFLFGLVTLIVTYINFSQKNGIGSMWCWIVNSIMVVCAFYILIFLPFQDKKKIVC